MSKTFKLLLWKLGKICLQCEKGAGTLKKGTGTLFWCILSQKSPS